MSFVPDKFGYIAIAVVLAAGSAYGQISDQQEKRIDAVLVADAPVLDGVLDDDVWASAAVFTDLHQIAPVEFDPPSEKAKIHVIRTKDALYVGVRFFDREPEKINDLHLMQGGYDFGTDSMQLFLDPLNQGRSGYAFDLNVNAIRTQGLFDNVTNQNWAWQGIWHAETTIDDEGWVAEIEIPFKTLAFDPSNDEWGLTVGRFTPRTNQWDGWSSSNRDMNPGNFGKLGGMEGAETGVGLDIVPSATVSQSHDFEADQSSDSVEPAIDIFYKVTPTLTASFTANTDFSGTSVDERKINLTRFGLFYSEKRKFFLQDTEIFSFGGIGGMRWIDSSTISRAERESGQPFFSRRIGLSSEGETVPINYGGKLTGRLRGWDIGLMGITQEASANVGKSDLFVARFARNILSESSVGAIFTSGDPNSDLDNTLAGIDFRYLNTKLPNGGTLQGALWYQQSDSEGVDDDQAAYGVSIKVPSSAGLRYGLSYKEFQENYYPALGFVNRTNVGDFTAELGYTWYPAKGPFQRTFSGIDYQRIETLDDKLQSQLISIRAFEGSTSSGQNYGLQYLLNAEVLETPFEISEGVIIPAGEYNFNSYCANASSAPTGNYTFQAYYCGGEFFDGNMSAPGATVAWRPSKHFNFSLSYGVNDIDLPQGSFITRLATLNADIIFSNTLYWANIVQYDNVTYGLGLNSILRWIPRAGREMVFVMNREFVDYTRDQNFTSVTGDTTFKFSYTFRF
ncbi:MAG: hypothetical protein CMO98_08730 [Woeseia sp.]|nr:hypothetical protein [Woeseia sp.]